MRAMVLAAQAAVETSPLSPIDRPIPEPGPGEVRVRVRACGACRTDIHVVEGDLPARRLPLIPGHQVVGTVDSLGPGAARFSIGDRVGIAWLRSTCGRCRFCLSGRENLCADSTYTGWTHDGGYAEYACVPEAFAYAIPPVFDDAEAAPLLCAGIIGYRALRRSRVPRGGRLGLYGFGSSAHITLQVARHWGCAVYVATREPARQRLALDLGAAWAGAPGDPLPDKLDAAIVFAPGGRARARRPPRPRQGRHGGARGHPHDGPARHVLRAAPLLGEDAPERDRQHPRRRRGAPAPRPPPSPSAPA